MPKPKPIPPRLPARKPGTSPRQPASASRRAPTKKSLATTDIQQLPEKKTAGSRTPRWERKAEERPEALFCAALEVFARDGYNHARLEDVARTAGVSKGTIYTYFTDKEDLLKKALASRQKSLLARAEAALEDFQGSATERLGFFLETGWARWSQAEWGRVHRLIFGEIASELPAVFKHWAKQGIMEGWRLAEQVIRQGQASGEFRPDADAAAFARLIYSGLSHQALLRSHMGLQELDPLEDGRILTAAKDLACSALSPRPAGKKRR